jgi:glutaminase
MVNAGAIAATSLVPGATSEAKWRFIHDGMSLFAGRALAVNGEVYASASATNYRNRSIAWMLRSRHRIYFDVDEATALYTRQCSLNVSARDLAVMAATLADGGVTRRSAITCSP